MSDCENCDSSFRSVNYDIDNLRSIVAGIIEESIEDGIERLKIECSDHLFAKVFNKVELLISTLGRWSDGAHWLEKLYDLNPKLFLNNFEQSYELRGRSNHFRFLKDGQ